MNQALLVIIVLLLLAILFKKSKETTYQTKYSGYLYDDDQFPFRKIIKIYNDADGLDYWGILREAGAEQFWVNTYGLVRQTSIKATMVSGEIITGDANKKTRFLDTNVFLTVSEGVTKRENWFGFYHNKFFNKLYLQVTKETYIYILEILRNKNTDDGLVFFMTGNRCKAIGGGGAELEGYLIDSLSETEIVEYESFLKSYRDQA